MGRRQRFLSVVFGIAILSFSIMAFGQQTGQITGTVRDSSGAVVPGAKIVVTNTGTTVKTEVSSNNSGVYVVPSLPVGTYTVSAQAKGFKTASESDVKLNVNDQLQVNFALVVGNMSETVNVEAAPVQVDLTTGTQATTITGSQIRSMALITRNYEQLVAMMPGVVSASVDQLYVGVSLPSGVTATIPFAVDGNRNSSNAWLVDGADNTDRGSNQTLLTTPSIDAIAEFKVERASFSAQLGRAAGGQIEVVTKSGTNAFHGNAYEYLRNNDLAANNFYNNATGVNLGSNGKALVPALHYNDFGWTLGGPIFIPGHYNKDKNKTFFFFSEEFRRVITYGTFTATAPTTAEIGGAFPTPVCLAYATGSTSSCLTTGTSVSKIDPIAQEYVKDIYSRVGLPTGSSNTLVNVLANKYNFEQELYKIDHYFGQKFQVSARFERDQIPTIEPTGIFSLGDSIPGTGVTNTNAPGRTWMVKGFLTTSPTFSNEVGYNFSYGAILSNDTGYTSSLVSPDVKVALPFAVTLPLVPTVSLSGGTGLAGYGPYRDFNRNHNFFDNAIKVHGAHTLKFGFVFNHYQKTENAASGNQGGFSFATTAPAGSGSTAFQQAIADFLLGNVTTFTQSSEDVTPDIRQNEFEAYVQDDWKLKSNFTLNVGVRYSNYRAPYDAKGELTTFDPSIYSATAGAAAIITGTGTTAGLLASTVTLPYVNGISINGSTSPYGKAIQSADNGNFAPRFGFAWDPFKTGKTSIRGGYGIFYDSTLVGTLEQNIFANPPYINAVTISNVTMDNPGGGTATVSNSPKVLHATGANFHTPYSQSWSLEIQRQFFNNWQLNVAYVGTKGTHLLGELDINELPPNFAYSSGLVPTTTFFTTSGGEQLLNQLRPYKGYNAINDILPWFSSNYHSLQVYGTKHFKGDNQIAFSYTWSKALTDNQTDRSTAAQNFYNFHEEEYGPAQYDRKFVLNINFVYMLPFFEHQKGLVGHALGGWQLSGLAAYYTGLPNTVTTSSNDPSATGLIGSSASSARPNEVCDPNSGGAQTRYAWFNASCIVPVPTGVHMLGDAGRGIVRGPGYEGWSFRLAKTVALGGEGRYNLQVLADASNAFNHSNPNGFGSLSNISTLFNTITSYRDPRIWQLGAKFSF